MKYTIQFYKAVHGISSRKLNVEINCYDFDQKKQRKAINESLEAKGIKERNYTILKVSY